jgi:hypothetical protein
MTLGRKKFARKFNHMGKKSVRAVKHAAHKVDLDKTGHLMQDIGSGAGIAAGILAIAAPELAGPALGVMQGLKFGGKVLEGGHKAKKQVDKGNYAKAAVTIEKVVVDAAKKSKSKLDKKYR